MRWTGGVGLGGSVTPNCFVEEIGWWRALQTSPRLEDMYIETDTSGA